LNYHDLIAQSRERFIQETAEHEMTVLRDDGLYRHLRFQRPESSFYWFDLVTWPGFLAVAGDCGDFMFSRTRDMFEFFGPNRSHGGFEDARWGINPDYWSQKLRGLQRGRDQSKVYSEESFRERLHEWAREEADYGDDSGGELTYASTLIEAVDRELRYREFYSEEQARQVLDDIAEETGASFGDAWEWDLREYDWQFLWCCWAIVWGIDQYRSKVTTPTEAIA
jgi:hypothetical protein